MNNIQKAFRDKQHLGLRMARGGVVRGPGTSTSDSVPAHLSDGEAVLPAKTVRAIGGSAAVHQLIEGTTGKPPHTGLRAGGQYADGYVDKAWNGVKDVAGQAADLAKSGYNKASGYVRGLGGDKVASGGLSDLIAPKPEAAPNYDTPPSQRGFESKVQPDIESRTSSTGKNYTAPNMDGAAQAGDQSAARAANTVEVGTQGPSSPDGLRTAAPGETPPKSWTTRATNWTARKAFEAIGGDTKVPSFELAPKGSIGPVRQGMGAATLLSAPNLVLRGARSMGYDVPDQALGSTNDGDGLLKRAGKAVYNPLEFIGTGLAESYARNAPEWAGGLSQKTLDAADKAGVSAWDNTPFAIGKATFDGQRQSAPSSTPDKNSSAGGQAAPSTDSTAEALSQMGVSSADQAGSKMSLNDALRTSRGEFGPAQPGKNYRLGLGSSPDTQMYVRLQGAPTKEEGAATTPGQLNDRLMSIQRGQTGAYGLGGSKFSDAEVGAINKGIRARGLAGATFTGVGNGQNSVSSGAVDPVEETARAYQKAFAKGDWNNAIPLKRVLDAQLQMRNQDTQLAGHNMQRQLGVANYQREMMKDRAAANDKYVDQQFPVNPNEKDPDKSGYNTNVAFRRSLIRTMGNQGLDPMKHMTSTGINEYAKLFEQGQNITKNNGKWDSVRAFLGIDPQQVTDEDLRNWIVTGESKGVLNDRLIGKFGAAQRNKASNDQGFGPYNAGARDFQTEQLERARRAGMGRSN